MVVDDLMLIWKIYVSFAQTHLVSTKFFLLTFPSSVSLMAHKAEIKYDLSQTNTAALMDRVEDLGFKTRVIKDGPENEAGEETIELRIQGMTCASCVNTIETNLAQLNGVRSAQVALTTGKAKIR